MAILVSIVCDMLHMTRRERVIFNLLKKEESTKLMQQKAAILVQRIWRRHQANKKAQENFEKLRDEKFKSYANRKKSSVKINMPTYSKYADPPNNRSGRTQTTPRRLPSSQLLAGSKTVLLVRNIHILKAITDFREARIANKYIESDHVDITDIGIKQSYIESEVKYCSGLVEKMNSRQNNMWSRIDDLESKLDKVLDKLELMEIRRKKEGEKQDDSREN